MKTLTVTSEPYQRFRVQFESRLIEIVLRLGVLRDRWSFDLSEGGVPLISGQRLVAGTDLLRGHGLELGGLFAVEKALTGLDALDPNATNFPSNFELIHATQEEVNTLGSAV